MSVLIKGMEMPKRKRVRTEKGNLMLWHIKNENVNKTELCGGAAFPCSLFFNTDGTVELSMNGKKYPIIEVPTPHGDLIERDYIDNAIRGIKPIRKGALGEVIYNAPTIIKAEE